MLSRPTPKGKHQTGLTANVDTGLNRERYDVRHRSSFVVDFLQELIQISWIEFDESFSDFICGMR